MSLNYYMSFDNYCLVVRVNVVCMRYIIYRQFKITICPAFLFQTQTASWGYVVDGIQRTESIERNDTAV